MEPLRTEGHDAGYNWRQRFPEAERILRGEGSAMYLAEGEGTWWVISDSGMFADFLNDEDLGPLIHLAAFASRDDAHRYIALATAERTRAIARAMLSRAGPMIAGELEAIASERVLETIRERDLQAVSASVLARTHPIVADPLPVTGQAPHGLSEYWPRLGNVDVALAAPPFLPVFVELKCGRGTDALGPCAWDLLKLAFALLVEATSAGFLMAAAPSSRWDEGIRGAELLDAGEWTAEELRESFAGWWRLWERDGRTEANPVGYCPPPSVPSSFSTSPLGDPAPFMVGSTPWRLRLAEVAVWEREWFAWEPFTE